VLHVGAVRRAVVVVWVGLLTAAESRIAAGRAERLWEEGWEQEGGRGQVEEGGTGEVVWYQRILFGCYLPVASQRL
jgi:hypothetical protein